MKLWKQYQKNWKAIWEKLNKKKGKNDTEMTEQDWTRRYIAITQTQEFVWDDKKNQELIQLVATRGNNWKLFEKKFIGRTSLQIRDHYRKIQKEGLLPPMLGTVKIISKFHMLITLIGFIFLII